MAKYQITRPILSVKKGMYQDIKFTAANVHYFLTTFASKLMGTFGTKGLKCESNFAHDVKRHLNSPASGETRFVPPV